MYCEYFGLKEKPFSLAPDPRYLFMSQQHWEAMAHLEYGIDDDWGFVLIVGEIGTGKTTLCRYLLEHLPENAESAFILNPMLTVNELLATICDEFRIPYPEHTISIKNFIDLINAFLLDNHARGSKAVLIIDEAQNLSFEVLEQLRLLTNLETNKSKLLRIILLGQPELRDKLSQPELQQMAQRITANYYLGPLSRKDVAAYIKHRLSVAGADRELFSPAMMNRIYRLTGGVPRLINILCDRALLGACLKEETSVRKSTLIAASRELFAGTQINEKWYWRNRIRNFAAAGIVLMLFFAAALHYRNPWLQSLPEGKTDKADTETVAEAVIERQKTGDFKWPEGLTLSRSRNMAYKTMLRYWGFDYHATNSITFCRDAELLGLRCLQSKGDFSVLQNLNLPAVLRLSGKGSKEFYGTLSALNGSTVTIIVGDETVNVDRKYLMASWKGDYTVLWQMPPGYEEEIKPGSRGLMVQWIDQKLASIQDRRTADRKDSVFDNRMVEDVKKFQTVRGITPDGVVGPMTLIHLNQAAGIKAPALTDNRKGP